MEYLRRPAVIGTLVILSALVYLFASPKASSATPTSDLNCRIEERDAGTTFTIPSGWSVVGTNAMLGQDRIIPTVIITSCQR